MRQKTIGILMGNICTTHSDDLLNGVIHRAEEKGFKVLIFMGAHANCFDEFYHYSMTEKESNYIYQFTSVYDYARYSGLDALIIAYSTFYLYLDENKEEFFSHFENMDIPIIIVGDIYKYYTSVISDNDDGIRKCVEHLINVHGRKKIAFLGGPKENNRDSKERVDSFYDTMRKNGLEVDGRLIMYGDYSANSSKLFTEVLKENPDIDGLVCANDTMALACYNTCKKYGLVPGEDISITGFDDIPKAKLALPRLTTIEQNTYDLGCAAIQKILDIFEKGDYSSLKVPVYFKKRESCGCEKDLSELIFDNWEEMSVNDLATHSTSNILKKSFLHKWNLKADTQVHKILYSVFLHVLNVMYGEEDEKFDFNYIDVSMHALLNSDEISTSRFATEFYVEFTNILHSCNGHENKVLEATKLLNHIMDYIQSLSIVNFQSSIDVLQRNIWTTPFITRDMIANINDTPKMLLSIMQRLNFMQINNAYLFLLEEPVVSKSYLNWKCPEKLILAAQIREGVISIPEERIILSDEHGLNEIISWDNCNNMAMYSLFAGEYVYGTLVCEMTPDNITSIYSASLHIGSAFQFIELMKKQHVIQEKLKKAMSALKNKNDILNMISEKDELTGLYNRRGFLENALSLIERVNNGYVLCIYADLDHLKQINDQFGHHEGDFAIKQAGQYLKDCLRSSDIIGRIGGDEFAAIAVVRDEGMCSDIKDRIMLSARLFNEMSDKEYYVELSIGYSVYYWDDDIELNSMLSEADAMLYKCKKHRRKDARKIEKR